MKKYLVLSLISLIVAGCSVRDESKEPPALARQSGDLDDSSDDIELTEPDPLELFNRYVYGFNRVLDAIVLKPVAIAYDAGVPESAKYCVESFLKNLTAPLACLNQVMRGQGEKTGVTLLRFLLNSTFGILGLIDFAEFIGIRGESADFNETLATWGVESGPYIMLPVLGPTTFRGAFGYFIDWLCDPIRILANHENGGFNRHKRLAKYTWYEYAGEVTVERARLLPVLDDIDETSIDPYVTVRSIVFQRQALVDKKTKS